MDRGFKRQRVQVEVAVIRLRLALAGLFAGEETAQRLRADLPDPWHEAGADGQGLVGEGLFAAGDGDHVEEPLVAEVDDRERGVDEWPARCFASLTVVDFGDDVGTVADNREGGIMSAFDTWPRHLEEAGHDLVAGGLGVPAGGQQRGDVRGLGFQRGADDEQQAAEGRGETFHWEGVAFHIRTGLAAHQRLGEPRRRGMLPSVSPAFPFDNCLDSYIVCGFLAGPSCGRRKSEKYQG